MVSTQNEAAGRDFTDEAAALWVESYQGEVLGEAYFARMRDLATDPVQKDKIDYLVRLERSTKELLAPALERRGLSTEPDRAIVEAMSGLDSYDWTSMLEGVRPVAANFLVKYRRLAELAGDDDHEVTSGLVAHELALDNFCECELTGHSDRSLDAILALPHFR
jgi:hypothetical protein